MNKKQEFWKVCFCKDFKSKKLFISFDKLKILSDTLRPEKIEKGHV